MKESSAKVRYFILPNCFPNRPILYYRVSKEGNVEYFHCNGYYVDSIDYACLHEILNIVDKNKEAKEIFPAELVLMNKYQL